MELKNVILQDQWDPVSAFHLLRVLSFQNLRFTFSGLLFKVDFVLPSFLASVWSLLYITSYMREWPFNTRCCRHGDGGPLMPPHPLLLLLLLLVFMWSFFMCPSQYPLTRFLRDSKRRVFTSFAFTFAHFATENVAFGLASHFFFLSLIYVYVRPNTHQHYTSVGVFSHLYLSEFWQYALPCSTCYKHMWCLIWSAICLSI